jgi:hypothetical protein
VVALGVQGMISPTAYILISTIIAHGNISQTTATFADKPSCESAATRQDFVYKNMNFLFSARWNLTCHPYQLNEIKK